VSLREVKALEAIAMLLSNVFEIKKDFKPTFLGCNNREGKLHGKTV